MGKIAFIIPWFGKFRNYFEFFVKSVEMNPRVDFFLITDQRTTFTPPEI